MKPSKPKTELAPSTQLRKGVLRGYLKVMCFGFALGLAFLTSTAFADVVGYFKFDTFPGGNDNFTDDAGKGLSGLLGYPFSQPVSVPGPSGQASDRAVAFDGKGSLVVDDSAAQILNIVTPPLTLECWVNATNFSNRYLGFISYGIPGGPPVAGIVRGGYKLGIAPNGNILFTLFAVVDVDSGIAYPFDGAWHHVAAIYSIPDGGVTFYLDGQNVAFIAETEAIKPPGNRQLDIGAQFTGLRGFEGAIDRARISKAVLTPAQLDSVAGTVKPVGTDTVVFFNFDEANPPYQGQGLQPAGVAVSSADWVINHPPFTSDGDPDKVTDTPSGAAGDLALQFDVNGADAIDMGAVRDPNGVLNLNGDWTLEAWVKYSGNVTGDRDVIFYYGHPGHGYSLSINYLAGNQLQVTTLGIADMPATAAVVEPDLWQHVAVVHKKGVSITYFTNGVEAETRAYTQGTTLATTNKVLYVGAEWNGGLPFTGFIDRVRISNSALTASQLDSDPKNPASSPAPSAELRIVEIKPDLTTGNITLTWEGDGPQFQVEKATTVTGPFQSLGAVQSARVYTDVGALKGSAQSFYRIRQVSTTPGPAACITTPAINVWVNTPFTNQTGTFTATFDATPSLDAPFDSVMALSSGPKTAFGDFACLVRFPDTGKIDARNGANYEAASDIPYTAGVKYSFRLVVNIPASTYSIYVAPAGGTEQTVGTDFAFRPTAGVVTNLNNWGAIVDETSGTNTVCNFKVSPAVSPAACITTAAPDVWVNTPIANQTGTFSVQFDATPSADLVDNVMALSSGPGAAFSDFACLTRFFTDGFIEARNGANYEPLPGVIPYSANVKYSFRLAINIPAHTYSIYVTPAGGTELTVGTDFDFRSDQSTVANLDNFGVIQTSAGTAGTNTVCNFKLVP